LDLLQLISEKCFPSKCYDRLKFGTKIGKDFFATQLFIFLILVTGRFSFLGMFCMYVHYTYIHIVSPFAVAKFSKPLGHFLGLNYAYSTEKR
jgi:hypothetical protein